MSNLLSLADEIKYYLEPVSVTEILPFNSNLHSAEQMLMISVLGSPQMPLSCNDQPERVSLNVKSMLETAHISQHIIATGYKLAVDSLTNIIKNAIAAEKSIGHDLDSVLGNDGMLVVRYRRPASLHGKCSSEISNHSWGTAIDLKIVGHPAPESTGRTIPRFISVLVHHFNDGGWYSGISFHDDMHFEVAKETIKQWFPPKHK